MRQSRSIRFHLSLVFVFFFLLMFCLGMLSIARLRDFNNVSADIAEVWLPNTRFLGDLDNYTSDFRADEGNDLLSIDPTESQAIEQEMVDLDRAISQAQSSYEQIRHDAKERSYYNLFRERWNEYRNIVNQMIEVTRSGQKSDAITTYRTTSRQSYNRAIDALGQLTKHVVQEAREASTQVAVVYRQTMWLIGVAMAIAGVLVVGALFYVSRSISTPLLHLAGYMQRLAANDTEIEISDTERADEIGEIARAAVVFRNNAIELMARQRGLSKHATILEEKLASERHLTHLQRNFVSMVSHEFRTPLTIIDGHARRLAKLGGHLGVEETGVRVTKIRAAVLRATHMIDNLLTSTRFTEGGPRLYFHAQELDLELLLRNVCQLHREMSPSTRLIEEFSGQNLRMVGDPKLLSQVLDNLISNAIKYSPGGASVKVSATREDGEIAVAVEDNGIGIPTQDIDRLFECYFRGSNVSGVVGTGVGLNLVKLVVNFHGGNIAVASSEGIGSRFTIRLPPARPSGEVVAALGDELKREVGSEAVDLSEILAE